MAHEMTLDGLREQVGNEVAVSDWIEIGQERIGLFADATADHQWIHLDAARCRAESPFGTTIAHGFLTLSLLPWFMEQANLLADCKMGVNYGLNKVRFPSPVAAGSRVRGRMTLLAIEPLADGAQLTWQVTVEREGGGKPACVAESIMRQYR